MHSGKSLLFDSNSICIKKDGDLNFDGTMGSYDGAEICELVGLYILHVLGEKYRKDKIGLYRDDGWACFGNTNRSQVEWIRKELISIFKTEFKLSITSETNLKIVTFSDVTLNLNTRTHEPYRKPNNNPLYININSNHPPKIIGNLPENIRKRISKLSSSIRILNNSKDLYDNALSASGFQQRIKFEQHNTSTTPNRNRKRNIIWFNPTYSANVTTKIRNNFLQILDKHLPKLHKFHKLFNHSNVKVSYSSLPNFASIINSHNKKILRQEEMVSPKPHCNCRVKESSPLNGDCLQSSVAYGCKITSSNTAEDSPHYTGLTGNTFKGSLYEHKNSFKYETKKNSTELSNYVWDKKKDKREIPFKWYIKEKAKGYSPVTKRCMLYLSEKFHILFSKERLLNKQNKIISKLRHENKHKLSNCEISLNEGKFCIEINQLWDCNVRFEWVKVFLIN